MKAIILGLLFSLCGFLDPLAQAGDWTTVPSPNAGKQANSLFGVAAVADNDVWAVGWAFNAPLAAYRTLIEHWDGVRWKIVRSPDANTNWNFLNDVAIASANDIWAVGQTFTGSTYNSLIEHWTGRQWQIVPSPNVPGVSNILQAITVISPQDIWVAGYTQTSNIFAPLTLHWNGTVWSIVAAPGQGRLNGIAAVSANDIWAAGVSEPSERSLTMHWNGTAWSVVASPNDSSEDNILWGVAALGPNDVWAVGAAGSLKTLAIHWDGTSWSLVPTPIFTSDHSNEVLVGIVSRSSTDIWTVGQYLLPLTGSAQQTLTEHWDGTSWSVVASPNAKNSNNRLARVTSTPNGTLWAVGTVGVFGKAERTLTLTKAP